jgi:hypothetical protein
MFKTGLFLEALPRVDNWVVTSELVWEDPVFGLVTVPRGLLTDLASVPYIARWVPQLDPAGLSRRPALVHDAAYARLFGWSKDKCDQFLRAALLAEGASSRVANVFYDAVHLFGESAWNSDAGPTQSHFVIPGSYEAWRATQKA